MSPTGLTLSGTGAGTVSLTAPNSYSGTTFIQAGSLQLGNGGDGGDFGNSSSVVLAGSANLAFDRTSNYTYNGAITSIPVGSAGPLPSRAAASSPWAEATTSMTTSPSTRVDWSLADPQTLGNPVSNTGIMKLGNSTSALCTFTVAQGGSLTQTTTANLDSGNGTPLVGEASQSLAPCFWSRATAASAFSATTISGLRSAAGAWRRLSKRRE